MRQWFLVDIGHACFGIEIGDRYEVATAPPIARWMLGKPYRFVSRWVASKGGTMQFVPEMSER